MSKSRNSSATNRLKRDYMRLKGDPIPYIIAEPNPSNILEWHYVVRGPAQSPYEGGYYHGKLVFTRDFPFRPPAIYMITPNGRFKTDIRLCLSISDFHPDTWNPAWSVSTILTGLLSFMRYPRRGCMWRVEPIYFYRFVKRNAIHEPFLPGQKQLEKTPTMGSIESSDCLKRSLAAQSLEVNLKDHIFCELFPDLVQEISVELQRRKAGSVNQVLPPSNNNYITQEHSLFHNVFANVFVLVGFVVFAYVVQYVIKSL